MACIILGKTGYLFHFHAVITSVKTGSYLECYSCV